MFSETDDEHLWRPLSTLPRKAVWGLIRPIGMTPVGGERGTADVNGTPLGLVSDQDDVHGRLEWDAHRLRRDAVLRSTSCCPSGVAPPWLPMAGTMNGSAPSALTTSITVLTTGTMHLIPRESTPRAIRIPGRIRSATWGGAQCSTYRSSHVVDSWARKLLPDVRALGKGELEASRDEQIRLVLPGFLGHSSSITSLRIHLYACI